MLNLMRARNFECQLDVLKKTPFQKATPYRVLLYKVVKITPLTTRRHKISAKRDFPRDAKGEKRKHLCVRL